MDSYDTMTPESACEKLRCNIQSLDKLKSDGWLKDLERKSVMDLVFYVDQVENKKERSYFESVGLKLVDYPITYVRAEDAKIGDMVYTQYSKIKKIEYRESDDSYYFYLGKSYLAGLVLKSYEFFDLASICQGRQNLDIQTARGMLCRLFNPDTGEIR